MTHSRSSSFSTASDNCENHCLYTNTWPGRKIISVIELMGLSEAGEQPRAAKEDKSRNRMRRRKEERRRRHVCMAREKEERVAGRKREKCLDECLLYCFIIRTEGNAHFSPSDCHDTVADKSHSVCTMGGFGMVGNLIDKAKQWHNACRPITFLFV